MVETVENKDKITKSSVLQTTGSREFQAVNPVSYCMGGTSLFDNTVIDIATFR